jgi:methionyl-tRNA formyltransferase
MTKIRTVFMGSDAIVLPLLESLATRHADAIELVGVYAQPDRPHGRGMKMQENPVKEWARLHSIPTRQPEKPNDEDVAWLTDAGCELLLVMAYGHILKDKLLAVPKLPPLNFHASLLPELRGASPIDTAIATGRAETGVTLMKIVKKMDAGDALDVEKVAILPEDNRASLTTKLAAACVPLADRLIPRLASCHLPFQPQDEAKATYCRILEKDDSNMDFAASACVLHNRARGLHLWPGSAFDFGGQRIKVGETALGCELTGAAPGTVLASGKTLDIATGSGILHILKMQRPGGKMLQAHDFLRGLPIPVGTFLESRPMKPLERC